MCTVYGTGSDIEKLAKKSELKAPNGPKSKTRWRHKIGKLWRALKVTGSAYQAFTDKRTNSWLRVSSKYFSESDFVTGVHLRNETYPTKVAMARGTDKDVLCRHCRQAPETVGHISGWCPKVKGYRIKRHSVIANTLADKCKIAGWMVEHEALLKDEENRVWKPE